MRYGKNIIAHQLMLDPVADKFITECCKFAHEQIFLYETKHPQPFLVRYENDLFIQFSDGDQIPYRCCPSCGARAVTCCKQCEFSHYNDKREKQFCFGSHEIKEIEDVKIIPDWCPERERD
jgi:hypothetical protein